VAGKAHHADPVFVKSGRMARAAANADPRYKCPTCGKTLAEIRVRKPHAVWHWDHVIPGSLAAGLRIRCSPCNTADGARIVNARRSSGYSW